MGFPSSGFEKIYRNDINDVDLAYLYLIVQVATLLQMKHQDHYLVLNLSGREYNYEHFGGRVISAGFPDHHSPPLTTMWSLYSIIDYWLALDPLNVIAVHCLAG